MKRLKDILRWIIVIPVVIALALFSLTMILLDDLLKLVSKRYKRRSLQQYGLD